MQFVGGEHARVEAKRWRSWRWYKASAELIRLGGASPRVASQWLFQAVNHALLMRPALTCFGRLYSFVREGERICWTKFTPMQLYDIQVFKGFIRLARVDIRAAHAPCALGRESSGRSRAVVATRARPREVMQLDRYLERALRRS